MRTFTKLAASLAFALPVMAQAALVSGTPSNDPSTPLPTPLFGTLIDFDDGAAGSCLAANQYAAQGVSSIVNTLGPSLCYFPSSQSDPNYVGTGAINSWNADFRFTFAALQAAVGIGIAGPTTMTFELYDDTDQLIEGYVVNAPSNNYYYINLTSNTARTLRIAGDFIAIDDLQFDTVPVGVPEPATLALVGLGLLGAAAARRRKA